MLTITPREDDYQDILDVLARVPEDAITRGAQAALTGARRSTRTPGGMDLRIVEFRTTADCESVRHMLEEFASRGRPTATQRRALARVVPQLYAVR